MHRKLNKIEKILIVSLSVIVIVFMAFLVFKIENQKTLNVKEIDSSSLSSSNLIFTESTIKIFNNETSLRMYTLEELTECTKESKTKEVIKKKEKKIESTERTAEIEETERIEKEEEINPTVKIEKKTKKHKETKEKDNVHINFSVTEVSRDTLFVLRLENANGDIVWSCSGEKVASLIQTNGNCATFSSISIGKAKIIATYNGKKYQSTIIVKNKEE